MVKARCVGSDGVREEEEDKEEEEGYVVCRSTELRWEGVIDVAVAHITWTLVS